jgi:hypothetical protein
LGRYYYGVFKLFYYANQKRDGIDSRVVVLEWLRECCWMRDYYLRNYYLRDYYLMRDYY